MSDQRDLWAELIRDMEARRQKGIQTYGKPVDPEDTEDWLRHGREELLDYVIYSYAAEQVVAELRARIVELVDKLEKAKDDAVWAYNEIDRLRNKYEPQDY